MKNILMVALRGRGGVSGEKDSWHLKLEFGEEEVSNTITSVQKDYLLMMIYEKSDTDKGEERGREAAQTLVR